MKSTVNLNLFLPKFAFLLCFCLPVFTMVGQVGIGNIDPKATLDITSSNVATPSNTDGVLIPRIDDFPLTDPGANQDGMMVFVTGNGTPSKGFYYWDQGTTAWAVVSGGIDTQNTLDGAYDEGGAGAGKNINASDGAVRINGEDGFLVTGNFGAGNTINTEVTGAGTRMFFNPRKAAFRAGNVTANQWDDANVGDYSVAMGRASTASGTYDVAIGFGSLATGSYSTALGWANRASGAYSVSMGQNSFATGWSSTAFGRISTASGSQSMVFGNDLLASGTRSIAIGNYLEVPSGYEIAMGYYGTTYTPNNTAGIDSADRLFSIGNGLNAGARNNALTIYKDGTMNINGAYNIPLTDGIVGQVMTTDGAGQISFQTPVGDGTGTDDQNLTTPTLTGTTLYLGIESGTGTSINLSALQDGNTQNNLDQAYDEGGPGAGRTINVDNGSLEFIGDGTPDFTGIITNTNAKNGIQINTSGNLVDPSTISSDIEINNTVNTNASFSRNNGVYNKMTVSGTAVNGNSCGFRNWFLPSGNHAGTLYGFYSNNQNVGNSGQYGYYSQINNNGNGYHYGYYSDIAGTGSGHKFGFHSRILSTTGGEHYGIYSDAQSATGYAAYFVGRTSLGIGFTNRYLMPPVDGTSGQVIVTDGTGNLSFQNAVTDTDNQQIDQLTLSGNILNISLQDDGVAPQTIDLSPLQDGTGTDDQTIDNFSLSGTTLRLSLESDGQPLQTVNLSSLQDGIGTDDQNLLTPTLTGATLNLGIEGGTGTSINLSALQDGTGTDDQRVNTFGLSGDTLGISLENDGDPVQTVDLSNLSFNVTNFALAKMSMSVAQTLAPNTSTKLNFDTAVFDLNGNFNTTTDRFEITETGYYRITASYRSNIGNTTTNWYDLYLGVNGVAVKRDDKDHHGNGTVVRQVSTVEYIASGGYIEVWGFAEGGLALSNSTQFTTFEVERIR